MASVVNGGAARVPASLQAAVTAVVIFSLGYVMLLPYPFMGGPALGGIPVLRLVPLAVGAALTCAALYMYSRRRADVQGLGAIGAALLAMVGIQALGAMTSMQPGASLAKVGFYALTGVPFFLAARTLSGARRDAVILSVALFTAAAGALSAAEFVAGRTPLFDAGYTANNPYYLYPQLAGRSFGTLGHPVFMGALFVLGLPCGFYALGRAKRPSYGGLVGLLIAAAVAGLLVTFTRSAWLAAVVGVLVFYRKRITVKHVIAGMALIAAIAVFAAGSDKVRAVLAKRNPVTEYVQGYETAHRLRAFGMVARIMGDAPLLGVGLGNYRTLYERYRTERGDTRATYATPDNMYLVTLAESGLMGLGLLLYILHTAYVRLKAGASVPDTGGAGASIMGLSALAGFVVAMFFLDALYVEPVRILFWTLMGVSMGKA